MTTDNSSTLKSLNWASTKAIGAVLVGGSGGNNRLYWMPEGAALGTQFSGTGFQNANGSRITKVTFCYHEPATVTIIKQVNTYNGGNASQISFPFTTTNLDPATFSLVDNNVVGPDRFVQGNLYKFAKWGQTITVTESLSDSWTLLDLSCSETETVPNQTQYLTTVDFENRKATIKLEEGERVVCTYSNSQLTPSAALVSVTGRVLNAFDTGIVGATVTMTDLSTGAVRSTRSSGFGYYQFDDVEVNNFYMVTVAHKRYYFPDNQRAFTLNDSVSDLNFVASP